MSDWLYRSQQLTHPQMMDAAKTAGAAYARVGERGGEMLQQFGQQVRQEKMAGVSMAHERGMQQERLKQQESQFGRSLEQQESQFGRGLEQRESQFSRGLEQHRSQFERQQSMAEAQAKTELYFKMQKQRMDEVAFAGDWVTKSLAAQEAAYKLEMLKVSSSASALARQDRIASMQEDMVRMERDRMRQQATLSDEERFVDYGEGGSMIMEDADGNYSMYSPTSRSFVKVTPDVALLQIGRQEKTKKLNNLRAQLESLMLELRADPTADVGEEMRAIRMLIRQTEKESPRKFIDESLRVKGGGRAAAKITERSPMQAVEYPGPMSFEPGKSVWSNDHEMRMREWRKSHIAQAATHSPMWSRLNSVPKDKLKQAVASAKLDPALVDKISTPEIVEFLARGVFSQLVTDYEQQNGPIESRDIQADILMRLSIESVLQGLIELGSLPKTTTAYPVKSWTREPLWWFNELGQQKPEKPGTPKESRGGT